MPNDLPRVTPRSRAEWRAWLEEHHREAPGVWVVYFKKGAAESGIGYDAAVEEALCFGWIDGKVRTLDAERYRQRYTPRRPGSGWSRLNKQRIERLLEAGRMTDAGLARIEAAKQDGSWMALDYAESLQVPDDLRAALDADAGAARFYESLPPSRRKAILYWVTSAKRPETRARRIAETAAAAAEEQLPGPAG